MADDFKSEKPLGADEAKKGAKPPVFVPKQKTNYPGMPEVTKSKAVGKKTAKDPDGDGDKDY